MHVVTLWKLGKSKHIFGIVSKFNNDIITIWLMTLLMLYDHIYITIFRNNFLLKINNDEFNYRKIF